MHARPDTSGAASEPLPKTTAASFSIREEEEGPVLVSDQFAAASDTGHAELPPRTKSLAFRPADIFFSRLRKMSSFWKVRWVQNSTWPSVNRTFCPRPPWFRLL